MGLEAFAGEFAREAGAAEIASEAGDAARLPKEIGGENDAARLPKEIGGENDAARLPKEIGGENDAARLAKEAGREGDDGAQKLFPPNEIQKKNIADALGWSPEKIEKFCRMNSDGDIVYKTDNQDMEGKIYNGVPYKLKTFTYNDIKIIGVFAEFDSAFDVQLPPEKYQTKAYAAECNKALNDAVKSDPELAKKFTREQLGDIENGLTPRGYVWHHNETPGKMQLVDNETHKTRHTGGNSIWGYASVDSPKKGVSF